MNKQIRIFCDMDGVVDDWHEGAARLCNIDLTDPIIRGKIKAGQDLGKIGVINGDVLWKKIEIAGDAFWENLQIFPWAERLIGELQKLGKVSFLSSPGNNLRVASHACAGKVRWLLKHFPTVPYIFAYEKHSCASADTILIDDSAKKIKLFAAEGGHVFHWPKELLFFDGDIDVDKTIAELVAKIKSITK